MTTKLYRVEITCSFYVATDEDKKSLLETDSYFHTHCLENELNFPDMISVEEVKTLDQVTNVWKDAAPYTYPSSYQSFRNCKSYFEPQPQT